MWLVAACAPPAVNDAVAQLSPAEREALGQIQVRLAEIEAEREARRLQHDETLAGQVAATAQAEQQYGTTYAKDTRPMLARSQAMRSSSSGVQVSAGTLPSRVSLWPMP